MVDKINPFPKFGRGKELVALVFVAVDEVNSSYHCFTLSESAKEDKNPMSFKVFFAPLPFS